jgi:hypothetical protein
MSGQAARHLCAKLAPRHCVRSRRVSPDDTPDWYPTALSDHWVVYGPRCRGGTTAPPTKTTAQGKDLLEDGNPNAIDNPMAPPSSDVSSGWKNQGRSKKDEPLVQLLAIPWNDLTWRISDGDAEFCKKKGTSVVKTSNPGRTATDNKIQKTGCCLSVPVVAGYRTGALACLHMIENMSPQKAHSCQAEKIKKCVSRVADGNCAPAIQ